MYNVIQGLLGIAILLSILLVLLLANEKEEKDMLGYKIVFCTKDYIFKSNTFFRDEPLTENELKEILQNALTIELAQINPDDIEEIYVVATDGEILQLHDLDPCDIWPSKNYRMDFLKRYAEFELQKGGEK